MAVTLGKTVRELEETLTYNELLDLYAYYELEPWGEERADMRNALLCNTIAMLFHWLVGKKSPYAPVDFMMFRDRYADGGSGYPVQPPREEEEAAPPAEGGKRGAKISSELVTQLFLASARTH